ncbi:hypothetical protein ABFV99_00625 [Cytobacillus horneckiae]|uniref:hypothetical protein n=1 Tax=Cytobacillus horneckiae TaxID=549687 RepID=UPI0034CEE6C9
MNRLVDLANVKAKRSNVLNDSHKKFIKEAVNTNKEMVINSIKNMKQFDPHFVIETVTLQIISLALAQKSQEAILEDIAGGFIFDLKDSLHRAFMRDSDVYMALGGELNVG